MKAKPEDVNMYPVGCRVYTMFLTDSSYMPRNFPGTASNHLHCVGGEMGAMIRENRQLVTDEPVEFEK